MSWQSSCVKDRQLLLSVDEVGVIRIFATDKTLSRKEIEVNLLLTISEFQDELVRAVWVFKLRKNSDPIPYHQPEAVERKQSGRGVGIMGKEGNQIRAATHTQKSFGAWLVVIDKMGVCRYLCIK